MHSPVVVDHRDAALFVTHSALPGAHLMQSTTASVAVSKPPMKQARTCVIMVAENASVCE